MHAKMFMCEFRRGKLALSAHEPKYCNFSFYATDNQFWLL